MLGHRPLNCGTSACCEPEEDPRKELDVIIALCHDVLIDASNYQNFTGENLHLITLALQKIIDAMSTIANNPNFVNNQIKIAITKLGQRFVLTLAPVVSFASTNLDTLIAIVGDTENNTIIENVVNNEIIERKYFSYVWLVTAGETECTINIPVGAIEVLLQPYTCFNYTIDDKFYGEGHVYVREARSIGNTILVESSIKVKIPAKAQMHVSYTALREIGDCEVVNGEVVPSDDAALAAIIAEGEQAVVVDESSSEGLLPRPVRNQDAL